MTGMEHNLSPVMTKAKCLIQQFSPGPENEIIAWYLQSLKTLVNSGTDVRNSFFISGQYCPPHSFLFPNESLVIFI